MLLCQVALGQMHECTVAKSFSADTLPVGTNSTKGCGQTIPDPKGKENFSKEKRKTWVFFLFKNIFSLMKMFSFQWAKESMRIFLTVHCFTMNLSCIILIKYKFDIFFVLILILNKVQRRCDHQMI